MGNLEQLLVLLVAAVMLAAVARRVGALALRSATLRFIAWRRSRHCCD
jgi:hypothetical protein